MTASSTQVLLLMGPTACGKTALAMALADRRPVHLINMDSAQVYRHLNIGAAKPTAAELAHYPHALIDVRDPAEPYSAADFVSDADTEVRSALAAGRLPVLVGGTMLYARAFSEGLAELPQADPAVRERISARAQAEGWPALHAELAKQDPVAAAGIHPNNHQRLQRALEVIAITGQRLSDLWQDTASRSAAERLGVQVVSLALVPQDRARLHAHIALRFERMLAAGLIEEVAALRNRDDLNLDLPALRAVGYRQTWQYLDGDFDRQALLDRGVAATRQLAKRQLTWLRSWPDLTELPADALLSAVDPEAQQQALSVLSDSALAALSHHLAK